MNKKKFKFFSFYEIFSTFFLIIFFFISIYLNQLSYDPRHNGIVYLYADYIRENFLEFPNIYFMYGLLNSYIDYFSLLLIGDKVFSLILSTNTFYFICLFLVYCFSKNFLNNKNSFFLTLILISIHPVIIHAWHSYKSFFFIIIALILIQNKNLIYVFVAGILLSLSGFLYNLNCVMAFIIFLFYVINFYIYKNKNYILILSASYFLPILVFVLIIFITNNFQNLINNIETNLLFGKITNGGIINIFINFFNYTFIEIPKSKIIYNNSYFVYLIVFVFNVYYSLINLSKFISGRLNEPKENVIYSLSILSLITSIGALHSVEIFRLLPSLSLGLIVLLYLLSKKHNNLLIISIVLYSVSSLIFPYLSSSSIVYAKIKEISKEQVIEKHNISILDNFYLRKSIVEEYIIYQKFLKNIKKNCDIDFFFNAQEKNFFLFSITKNYFKNKQKFAWQNSIVEWEKIVKDIYVNDSSVAKSIIIINQKNQKKYLEHYIAHEFYDFKNNFKILLPNSCAL